MSHTRHIIRTSDRGAFKKCRYYWDFGSKIRMDYEPVRTNRNLGFGTAVHAGLESFYDPRAFEFDLAVRTDMAVAAGLLSLKEQLEALPNPSEEELEEYAEERERLVGMLRYYADWSGKNDRFRPLMVEQEFEIPILVPAALAKSESISQFGEYRHVVQGQTHWHINGKPGFTFNEDRQLYYKGDPVVYQGRIDLVVQDDNGEVWIVDYKTTKSFGDTAYLERDSQISSYAYALIEAMGIEVAGVVFIQLKKTVPHPPALVYKGKKNERLSTAKDQCTTVDMFMEAIHQHGYNPADYEEVLAALRNNGDPMVRRLEFHRDDPLLQMQGEFIFREAIDMLNDPSIYPNPTLMNCNGCWFQGPCLARIEGSDWEFMLGDTMVYEKRS